MKLTIGMMGSSGGGLDAAARAKAYRLGEAIAARDATLITGVCLGLPYEAVRGANAEGRPRRWHLGDVLIYMSRQITNIRSCGSVLIARGRTGTLGEPAIAYDEGRLLGILTETGGITGFGLVVLTLAVGFCLFDGDETGTPGHLSVPDLCNGLALIAFAVTLLGLAATGEVSLSPAAATSALRGAGWNRPRSSAPSPSRADSRILHSWSRMPMLVCHLGSGDRGRLGRGDGDKGPDERSHGEPVAGHRELQNGRERRATRHGAKRLRRLG